MSRDVISTIEKNNYAATTAQVEQVAHQVYLGVRGDATYLRILGCECLKLIGRARRRLPEQEQLAVVDKAHGALYPHVLKGVTNGDEIAADEQNRRATFARSAASTLRFFVRGGGDLRTLDLSGMTKGSLRRSVQPEKVQGQSRVERASNKALAAFYRSIERMARSDAELAREHLEAALEEMSAKLDALVPHGNAQQQPDFGATTTTVGRMPGNRVVSRVPAQLHQGARS